MDNIFEFYINSAFITCIFVLGAIVFHFFLRKRPSSQLLLIWFFVLIRLLVPLSINVESEICAYTIPQEITNVMSNSSNNLLSNTAIPDGVDVEEVNNNKIRKQNQIDYYLICQVVWLIGILFFIIYYLLKMFWLNRKIKYSIRLTKYKNVWMWNDNTGACVIGLFRPRIYVPLGCEGPSLDIIVQHETQHIKHFDYLFVYLFYFALAINWYNPLVWIAYKMAIQDVEKACDERVLLNSTVDERRAYARVLLELFKDTSAKSMIVGFGTSNIKKRIKNIGENKQKWKIYTIFIILICCCFLSICALFHIKTDEQKIVDTIGKEEIGSSMPEVIYADSNICIFYDYHGVFVYELSTQKLSDYIAFSEIGFSSNMQGDNTTFAFSGDSGKKVYITNYTKLYIYDCDEERGNLTDYSAINMPQSSLDSLQVIDEPENNAISQSYILANNAKLYWKYEGSEGRYSGLRLIFDKNGDIEEYTIFR